MQVKRNYYRDSLNLLKISDALKCNDGILEAAVVMGTRMNKEVLVKLGFPSSKVKQARDSDLLVAIQAENSKSMNFALIKLEELLNSDGTPQEGNLSGSVFDVDSALSSMPDANLALISIPGEYVRDLSIKLTDVGIHQQIFSDHVPLKDELKIKEHAVKRGVLILGPGAGTSIINGRGIGFSNAVRTGPVGIVAAAGTGLQEVSTLLDHCDIGVKHALGVGGNDPKKEIGGLMMLESLKVLEALSDIEIIAIVSKPPSHDVEETMVDYIIRNGKKKYVLAFIGGDTESVQISNRTKKKLVQVNTLASAVFAVARLRGRRELKTALERIHITYEMMHAMVKREWKKLHKQQKYVRALYTGGTFAYEAQVILNNILEEIYSNTPTAGSMQLHTSSDSQKNSILDLGEEEFTQGRAHPMIDPTVRKLRLIEESRDPKVGVILMDFVLGYGSHSDPVGAVINEIRQAKKIAEMNERHLSFIIHVCGTMDDVQGYRQSVRRLESAGSLVFPTNALAVIAAAHIISRGKLNLKEIYSNYFSEVFTVD